MPAASMERSSAGPRTAEEWLWWAASADAPGDLIRSGAGDGYPEIAAAAGVPQEPEWHPEGPVDVHTAFVLDAAAAIAEREGLSPDDRIVLIFAALTHDLGKARTTRLRRTRRGARWTSYGHAEEGARVARRLLERIGIPEEVTARVERLVMEHMAHRDFARPGTGVRTVRRLAARLAPATIRQLVWLVEADHSGRPPLPKRLPPAAARMVSLAREAGLLDGPPGGPEAGAAE